MVTVSAVWWLASAAHHASYATGAVGGGSPVGGLVGIADSNSGITASYATGPVESSQTMSAASWVSSPQTAYITSYATGAVTGNGGSAAWWFCSTAAVLPPATLRELLLLLRAVVPEVGGLVGVAGLNINITTSYWDSDTSTQLQGVGGDDTTGAPLA